MEFVVTQWAVLAFPQLDEAQIGAELVAEGFVRFADAFREGHFRLGEAIGSHDMCIGTDKSGGDIAQTSPQTVGAFFTSEHEALQHDPPFAGFMRLTQNMVNEGGHADEDIGLNLVDELNVVLGAKCFAAANAATNDGCDGNDVFMEQLDNIGVGDTSDSPLLSTSPRPTCFAC